jgi:hypothetical protein
VKTSRRYKSTTSQCQSEAAVSSLTGAAGGAILQQCYLDTSNAVIELLMMPEGGWRRRSLRHAASVARAQTALKVVEEEETSTPY